MMDPLNLVFCTTLAVFVLVPIAIVNVRRRGQPYDWVHVLEEIGAMLRRGVVAVEERGAVVAALLLTGVVGYAGYLGASALGRERGMMQMFAGAAAAVVFEGHRRLAGQPVKVEERQSKLFISVLVMPFCAVSLAFGSIGLYAGAVAPDLKELEKHAWERYYRETRGKVAAKLTELVNTGAEELAHLRGNASQYREDKDAAQREQRPYTATAQERALPEQIKRLAKWQEQVGFTSMPATGPSGNRQTDEQVLASSVEHLNQLISTMPMSKNIEAVWLEPYTRPTTDLLTHFLGTLRSGDLSAWFCVGLSGLIEFLPLGALLLRHRRVRLHERIDSLRESCVLVLAALRRSWYHDPGVMAKASPAPGKAAAPTTTGQAAAGVTGTGQPVVQEVVRIEFDPPIHAPAKIEWQRSPALSAVSFDQVQHFFRNAIEQKLAAAGYRFVAFVTSTKCPVITGEPLLGQLAGEPLVIQCERIP
ncbi:MAG: hypothetical protein K1X67_15155 [Fimbriimonadaceae bacterium]|nr:hypothetical protein [Fimbriimonadaceae bacterium]